MIGVYEIVNQCDGEETTYVGSSIDIERRWEQHRSLLGRRKHHCIYLQNAWNKYGEDAFSFNVLKEVDADQCLPAEQEYLDSYLDKGNCYNIKHEVAGGPLTEEHRLAISKACTGRVRTKEHQRKLNEAHKGKKFSLETRRKMSRSHKGQVPWCTGQHLTAEHKRNLSESLKGRLGPMKGKRHTDEAKRKMSEKHRGMKPSLETRRKMSKTREREYPAFCNEHTGEIIPAGVNLAKLCRQRGWSTGSMCDVKNGKRQRHKGWILLKCELSTGRL